MDLAHVPPWSRRRRLTLGLTALALIAGGGVAIAAGNPDTDLTAAPETATAPGPPGLEKAASGLGGVLHSESVVSDGDGGYVTRLTQTGTIASIDSDRLTVRSEDGYERSWNRTADTVVGGPGWSVRENDDGSYTVRKDTAEPGVGDQVLVVGSVEDDVATADRIAARPDTGPIPGVVLKRFEGEFGDRSERPMHGDRLLKRFEGGDRLLGPGPMRGPGEDVRTFGFPSSPEETAPAPENAVPAEPSASVR